MNKKRTAQLRHHVASTRRISVSAPSRHGRLLHRSSCEGWIGEGGFFSLRLLIGVFVVMAGVFLALAGLDAFSALTASMAQAQQKNNIITNSKDPLVPNGFDCSKIHELGIDTQENMRAGAIMIACGQAQGGGASSGGGLFKAIKRLLSPLAYGSPDVDLITGTETYPNVTQSETFSASNPDNPSQIVVAYNDSRGRWASPINIAGASVSTDGGTTFTRLTAANGQSPFLNTFGDPVVLYNKPSATWYTVWSDPGCGSTGLGGYKSTTPWDPSPASWTHYCVHTGSNDSRESGWADNNPASPFYGRMYVSYNDFTVSGGALFVHYSTDNGLTWTNERQITTTFIRNVQITGDLVTGDVYIAGMNEGGGGFPHNCSNLIFRSTDGGNTWTNTYTGPTFSGPGRAASGYFATMYNNPAYWTHEGWGEPAALNHVVHYVYAARNPSNGDPGDVFYIRSTDSGVTFSAPFQLNSNTDSTKAQWQPNLSVSPTGTLFAVWYDETPRVAASCQPSSPDTPCYQMHARKSNDNGVSWLPDDVFSDVASPLPLQVDPGIRFDYAGDYDYASAVTTSHRHAWAEGRVIINGASQQDAFTDKQLIATPTPTPTPTPTSPPCSVDSSNLGCGGTINFQPTEFSIDVTCPVDPATVHPSSFTVNNIQPDSFTILNGNLTIRFHYNTTPVVQGLNTMHIPAGGFNCACGPVAEFTCTFTYQPSTPTPTPTPTVTPCQITITQITGTIVPGTVDISNHCDCVTTISLPFSFTLYDQTFTSVNLSSNGNAQFLTMDTTFTNTCLPWTTHNYTIYPYWDDLYLVNGGYGIFTSISGAPPNRIFNIEWRSQ